MLFVPDAAIYRPVDGFPSFPDVPSIHCGAKLMFSQNRRGPEQAVYQPALRVP